MNLKPLHDWVLVKMDPFPEKQGSIIVLEDSSPNRIRTGTVLLVGAGLRDEKGERIHVGLGEGERVAFFRWNLEHQNGKRVTAFLEGFGDDLGLIRAKDILMAWSANEKVNVT